MGVRDLGGFKGALERVYAVVFDVVLGNSLNLLNEILIICYNVLFFRASPCEPFDHAPHGTAISLFSFLANTNSLSFYLSLSLFSQKE